jgi:hypothetical protein
MPSAKEKKNAKNAKGAKGRGREEEGVIVSEIIMNRMNLEIQR